MHECARQTDHGMVTSIAIDKTTCQRCRLIIHSNCAGNVNKTLNAWSVVIVEIISQPCLLECHWCRCRSVGGCWCRRWRPPSTVHHPAQLREGLGSRLPSADDQRDAVLGGGQATSAAAATWRGATVNACQWKPRPDHVHAPLMCSLVVSLCYLYLCAKQWLSSCFD